MAESLVLFESVINSRWFLRTSIILFLNKIDVFKLKLPKVCSVYCGVSPSPPDYCRCHLSISLIPSPRRNRKDPDPFPSSLPLLPCVGEVWSSSPPLLCAAANLLVALLTLTLLPLRSRWNDTSQNTPVAPISTRRPSTSCGSSCRQIERGWVCIRSMYFSRLLSPSVG